MGIGKIARAFSGGVEGTNIIPLLGIKDDGTPIYGQPVNMPVVASSIIAAIEEFAKAAETKIGELSRKETRNLVRNFKKLSKIIDPVTKFADMISTFATGDKLYITEIDENGKQTKREVDLKGTATKIVDAINAFTIALDYDKLEELGKRRARKGAEALGYIMSPIEGFINSISKIGSVTTDNPDIIGIIGENGSVREVNIVKVADAISRSIVQFIEQIDGVITNKKDSIKNISKNSENFKIVIEQISSMTSSISMLDGEKIMKANTSFVGFLDTLKAQSTPENTEVLQGMSKTVNELTRNLTDSADKMKISIGKLDESILNKSDKRIKALKDIAEAMKKISDNSKDMESAMTSLQTVLDKLTALDSSALQTNATNLNNALGNIRQNVGGVQSENNTAGTAYLGLTQQDIINAITYVLNGLTIHGFKVPVGPSMSNTTLWDQAEESPLIIGVANS